MFYIVTNTEMVTNVIEYGGFDCGVLKVDNRGYHSTYRGLEALLLLINTGRMFP